MDENLKTLIKRVLVATKPLAEAPAVADTKFLTVFLGIYRISFTTLRDIDYLSSFEETGASILDLTRKVIEHSIAIEYIILKGKEEYAARFQDYLTVQLNEEIGLIREVGQDPAEISEELGIAIARTEAEFAALPSDMKKRKNWAGIDFVGMLKALNDAGTIGITDSPQLLSAYVWGSRSNHPNPFATAAYLDVDQHQEANAFYTRIGLLMALVTHIRLTTQLIDASRLAVGSDVYGEMAAEFEKIQDELNTLD